MDRAGKKQNTAASGPFVRTAGMKEAAVSLLDYCRSNDWSGYDPYDALNSALFMATPFSRSRLCRIAITQVMKRLPINLRPLLGVSKEQNPKALALFLMAGLKLSKLGLGKTEELPRKLIEQLAALRTPGSPYWCWGYSFPWQTRRNLVPRGAANLVCTTFAANALLDAYEDGYGPRCLEMAASAGEYILNELYWTEGDDIACFSYPLPSLRAKVHNANFLAAALFSRIAKHTGETRFLLPALKAARYSVSKQQADGSWDYGELPTQKWVDNFHTGYNLCALRTLGQYAGTDEFEIPVERGLAFYRKNFFRKDWAPKYFHNRDYPIDIHSVAQSIITLTTFKNENKESLLTAFNVGAWALNNLRHEKGYFYYQALPYYRNRISYMRWSQAWMLLALATLLEQGGQNSFIRKELIKGERASEAEQ